MAEFVGGEPISIGVDESITFENKTDTAFDVGCGIVFRKSGLYRVSIVERHMSVAVEPERKKGRWLNIDESEKWECSECGRMMWFSPRLSVKPSDYRFCPNCGADMREGEAK